MRISGRYGLVKLGAGSPLASLGSINGWDLSQGRNYIDVTSFLDTNKVSVPDLPDISGNVKGFYDLDAGSPVAGVSLPWLEAAEGVDPVLMELYADSNNMMRFWTGPAYLDMKVDVQVAGAVTLASAFKASGNWSRN